MKMGIDIGSIKQVALRKESVDRNAVWADNYIKGMLSLSARRAIEIYWVDPSPTVRPVALRKESVDRNPVTVTIFPNTNSRSPQGERG